MKPRQAMASLAIVVGGVLLAGLLMGTLRGRVPLIEEAHSGFDS